MKKALAILMIFALVASVAVAEISIGAWGRGLFVPVSNTGASDDESVAENKASWGGAPRIGFTIAGNSDNVGFQVDMNGDGGNINAGDQQLIWVKPMDMLKLSLGRVQVDTLRGNAAFGSWNWNRDYGDGSFGEDFTFSRMATGAGGSANFKNDQGLIIEVTPMDALWVGLALRDVNYDYDSDLAWAKAAGGDNLSANLIANMQFAFGYTIADVGQLKAQIIRNPSLYDADGAADENNDTVEIAFNTSMVENLFVEAGFRMWTDSDAKETKEISIYAKYGMDAMTFHLASRVDINGEIDTPDGSGDMGLYVGAGVDYALDGGIGISADIRYANGVIQGYNWDISDYNDDRITFFAGVTKGFSNGLIGAGVEVVSAADTGYSIPVRFEYWF